MTDDANAFLAVLLGKEMDLLPAYSVMTLMTEPETEEEDPWSMPVLQDTGVRWSGKYFSQCAGFYFYSILPSSP